jgi:hypothetical protein
MLIRVCYQFSSPFSFRILFCVALLCSLLSTLIFLQLFLIGVHSYCVVFKPSRPQFKPPVFLNLPESNVGLFKIVTS